MAKKSIVTDDQIRAAILKSEKKTLVEICGILNMATGPAITKRIKKLRREEAIINPVKIEPEPEIRSVNFSEILPNDRLKKDGKLLIVTHTGPTYITVQKMDGNSEKISRNQISKGGYERIENHSACGPVETYYIAPGTEPSEIPSKPTTREDLTENQTNDMADRTNVLKIDDFDVGEDIETGATKKQVMFDDVDYVDPDWGVGPSSRDYLGLIGRFLDIMIPECRKNPMLKVDTMSIAKNMLDRGFKEEVSHE